MVSRARQPDLVADGDGKSLTTAAGFFSFARLLVATIEGSPAHRKANAEQAARPSRWIDLNDAQWRIVYATLRRADAAEIESPEEYFETCERWAREAATERT